MFSLFKTKVTKKGKAEEESSVAAPAKTTINLKAASDAAQKPGANPKKDDDSGGSSSSSSVAVTIPVELSPPDPVPVPEPELADERVTTQINARMAPLSDVEAAAVAKALELPHDETELVDKFNISISRRLMSSLTNGKWLNDEVKYFIRSFLL